MVFKFLSQIWKKSPFYNLWQEIPLLYRYLVEKYFEHLVVVFLSIFILLAGFLAFYFFNISKIFSFKILFNYVFNTIVSYYIFIIPLVITLSLVSTAYLFRKKRFTYILFSLGVEPSKILVPFWFLAFLFSFLGLVYFQAVYPKAMLLQKKAYLESKKKPLNFGIVENFWYRTPDNTFITFELLDLQSLKAFQGYKLQLGENFKIVEVVPIKEAIFQLYPNAIIFKYSNSVLYGPGYTKFPVSGVIKIPYDEKLLKVKKPEYMSLTDLFRLITFGRNFNINLIPFVWELIKRFLIAFFLFWITLYVALLAFGLVRVNMLRVILESFLAVVLFYSFIFIFNTLVVKVSINPWYSLLVVPLFGVWFFIRKSAEEA